MKIAANSAGEFMAIIKRSHKGVFGTTKPLTDYKYGSFKDGSLEKVEFTLKVTIESVQAGSGSPDAENKAAIEEIVAAAKEHEENHRDSYQDAFDKWDQKKQSKELMGETYKNKAEAEKALQDKLKELNALLKKACLALHSKEGELTLKQEFTVVKSPEGPSGCG